MSDDHLNAVYAFICQHIKEHTHPPTIREISEQCWLSRSNVVRYLDQLEGRGYIAREPGRARGITLLKPCQENTGLRWKN